MNKKCLLSISAVLASLLLAACDPAGEGSSGVSTPFSESSREESGSDSIFSGVSSESSSESASESESTTESTSGSQSIIPDVPQTNLIQLRMYGGVYLNHLRSVYALLDDSLEGKPLVWTSTDESIVTVEDTGSVAPEAYIYARAYGTATVMVALEEDPNVYRTIEITVEEGEAMPEETYKKLTGGLKITASQKYIAYDAELKESIDTEYRLTTIYEENRETPNIIDGYEYTDAYQLIEENLTKGTEREWLYVRSSGGDLATETITKDNEIGYSLIYNDDGYSIDWRGTVYWNYFANNTYFTASDFRSFDGGKTYHCLANETYLSYLCASLFLSSISPDDFYITVDGENLSLTLRVDPYNSDKTDSTKYGQTIEATITEIGTATIRHRALFEHEDFHDDVATAITNMASSKNYKVAYDVSYSSSSSTNAHFEFIYTEDTIDQKVMSPDGLGVISHTGIHKTADDEYVEYSVATDGTLTITDTHAAYWETDTIKRYPTFAFAAETFGAPNANGVYACRADNSEFLRYMAYLPGTFGYASFNDDGVITLDGSGHIATASGTADYYDETITISYEFSEFGTADHGLTFESAVIPDLPTSWAEDGNKWLYEDMTQWQIDGVPLAEIVPYVYCPAGYDDYVSSSWSDYNQCTFTTEDFLNADGDADVEAIEAFIAAFKEALVNAGFVLGTTTESANNNAPVYEKDGIGISVAREVNWSGEYILDSVKIVIRVDDGNRLVDTDPEGWHN